MIEILIFHLHIVGVLYAFTTKWQSETIKDALLAVTLIMLFFFIGWALTGTFAHAIYPDAWKSIYFGPDALSLLLLLPFEIWLFTVYILKGKQTTLET